MPRIHVRPKKDVYFAIIFIYFSIFFLGLKKRTLLFTHSVIITLLIAIQAFIIPLYIYGWRDSAISIDLLITTFGVPCSGELGVNNDLLKRLLNVIADPVGAFPSS